MFFVLIPPMKVKSVFLDLAKQQQVQQAKNRLEGLQKKSVSTGGLQATGLPRATLSLSDAIAWGNRLDLQVLYS